MAATIKPIEAKSVHQIQSGQVIVDLCSVVKELVENALDAEATVIEVRFKNYGLESIEVQDNGTGIAESNYEGLALKHYTSKLSTYDDLSELQTFGFRGEALSSLCALSVLSVITAQAHEAPKGKRLEFETSGKLKSITLTAAQRGTTVTVESLFSKLPVRQKELNKNIKREYGKVLSLLQSYACISTNVKFTVKNAMPKSRSAVAFSTKGNSTTRENIANVYGAKMLSQLIELDLRLEFQPSLAQAGRKNGDETMVNVVGHISKPVFGEGRQTPDRQMFFANGRPCGLPQISKAINEVYKSYNVTQSPFIFADFRMDTSSYDVNVSPDKRTILLHDATALTDRLKEELTKRFDDTEQTVPQSLLQNRRLPAFRHLTVSGEPSREGGKSSTLSLEPNSTTDSPVGPAAGGDIQDDRCEEELEADEGAHQSLRKLRFGNIASTREEVPQVKKVPDPAKGQELMEGETGVSAKALDKHKPQQALEDDYDDGQDVSQTPAEKDADAETPVDIHVRHFNARMQEQQNAASRRSSKTEALHVPDSRALARSQRIEERGVVTDAFDRMRARRLSPELATITIGDRTITRMIGTPKHQSKSRGQDKGHVDKSMSQFSQSLRKFDIDVKDEASDEDDVIPSDEDAEQADILPEHVGEENTPGLEPQHEADRTDMSGLLEPVQVTDQGGRTNHFSNTQQVRMADHKLALSEAADRTQEEYRVAELIRMAETTNFVDTKERQRRTNQALKSGLKDSTVDIVGLLNEDLASLKQQAVVVKEQQNALQRQHRASDYDDQLRGQNEEEQLSLTISKLDFAKMHIAGQFNLGFIIALRHRDMSDKARQNDELFIIDQHASDEKYNFERLQAETVVGNQRLVHPVMLDLTAVEEEIVLENDEALRQNGFIIESDTSGNYAVGTRCKLLSLPLSKEVTFNTKDLEELIHLLSESHVSAASAYIPRPNKVRKMFAMRACRSSIMIGKTLSMRQMRSVIDHMGKIDKPWNCPHGRPTMRHLISLDQLESGLWKEGDGLVSEGDGARAGRSDASIWQTYLT